MPLLQRFADRHSSNATLRVFCPDPAAVVTTFENSLPTLNAGAIAKISRDTPPDLPVELSWNTLGHDYYAFLPKFRSFEGHLLTPLNHHRPTTSQRDGRWYVDANTIELWRSLDRKLTESIKVISSNQLVELDHYEPSQATAYGFARGHRSQRDLEVSLRVSRHAFIHRLAYLTYSISCCYKWDTLELSDQPWWSEFVAKCGRTWVDSVWDAVCRQWNSRNFIGIAVRPGNASVKWLRAALNFGVPIWVTFPQPRCYAQQDGGSIIADQWEPTNQQVIEARRAQMAEVATLQAQPTPPPPSTLLAQPTPLPSTPLDQSKSNLSPPPVVPQNARWYESWQEFFRKRDEAQSKRLASASPREKQIWDSRTQSAKKRHPPGKGGAKVYVWEECDSGGFFRILKTHYEAVNDWDYMFGEALVFSAQDNIWDYCPFKWTPAVESGAPDDTDSDDGYIGEHWYAEPGPSTTFSNDLSSSDFLYHRYGFLSVPPTTPPGAALPFSISDAGRIVGLAQPEGRPSVYELNTFITAILQGQSPPGRCDLSTDSPFPEKFSVSKTSLMNGTVHQSCFPELSDGVVFTLIDGPNNPQLITIHQSLSILQLVRVVGRLDFTTAVEYLLHNGLQFTLLYPQTQAPSPPNFSILTFPLRPQDWKATTEDYNAYISRVKTFLLERPHVAAAALSRGGIAWRIVREVLGIEDSIKVLRDTYPDQGSSVNTKQGTYWFHEPNEGEWFYLVGGYELLTGSLFFSFVLNISLTRVIRKG